MNNKLNNLIVILMSIGLIFIVTYFFIKILPFILIVIAVTWVYKMIKNIKIRSANKQHEDSSCVEIINDKQDLNGYEDKKVIDVEYEDLH